MAEAWDDYFDPGETLLWQGAPERSVKISPPGEAVVWEGKQRKGIQLWPGMFWMILGVPMLVAAYF